MNTAELTLPISENAEIEGVVSYTVIPGSPNINCFPDGSGIPGLDNDLIIEDFVINRLVFSSGTRISAFWLFTHSYFDSLKTLCLQKLYALTPEDKLWHILLGYIFDD